MSPIVTGKSMVKWRLFWRKTLRRGVTFTAEKMRGKSSVWYCISALLKRARKGPKYIWSYFL